MADVAFAARTPLAHLAGPSRIGRLGEELGVTVREERDLTLTLLVANRNQVADMRRAAQGIGVILPTSPTSVGLGDGAVLWAGPEQWLIATRPSASAQAEALIRACGGLCLAVDQSDARALIAIGGPKARDVLAKGYGLDLHPRAFRLGDTAVAPAAGVATQIWLSEATPRYIVAVPRSYAEGFWAWLTEAAAEYGCAVVE